MKLRQRLIIVSAVCLVVAGWGISDVALKSSINGFKDIEHERAEVDVTRVHEAFQNNIVALHTKSADWANWDDTYAFVADRNPAYIESNLAVESLRSIRIDLLMILDAKGQTIKAVGVPNAEGKVPEPDRINEILLANKLLDPTKDKSGFVTLGDQAVMLSIRPVFPTNIDKPSRGYIVFGQRLNDAVQSDLRRLTRQPTHFRVLGKAERMAADANPRITDGALPQVKVLSENELVGSTIASDLLGQPGLVLETKLTRRVLAYGKTVGRDIVIRVLGIATLAAIFFVLMIERLVITRVRSLHDQLSAVGADVDGTRVSLDGRDELALLATQVNTMLARIERGSRDLRSSEERMRLHNENLEHIVAERTREIEASARALRESEERLRLQNENLEQLVEARTQEIEHQAFHDKLTGLPNRALFMNRLNFAMTKARRDSTGTAVMFIDLDNFKLINDSLGHDRGDQLLIAVAARLNESVRAGDTVSRLGGDEFTVILEGINSAADTEEVADRVLASLRKPIKLGTSEIFTGASIGIALSTDGRISAQDLLKHADVAMYRAKETGKSAYVVFDDHMNAHALERLELETALRKAIDTNSLTVAYQPIVDLASGEVVGAEALARWDDPDRGSISPIHFIPIAEDTGLIVPLGYWILEEACRQAADWIQASGDRPFTINVNVSGRQLKRDDIVDRVRQVLHRTGLPASRLKLEITESVLLDNGEEVAIKLQGLKKLGLKLALDDFGTGYSSLSTLRSFPIDTLKVDRGFIRILGDEPGAMAIVEAIAALAQTMKMDVTAEGVETAAHEAILQQLGIAFGQGYHYAKPLPAADFHWHVAYTRLSPKAA